MATIKLQGQPTKTTPGSVGDTYIDTLTGVEYKCTFAYNNAFLKVTEFDWVPTGNIRRTPTIDIPVVTEEVPKEIPKEVVRLNEPVKDEKPKYVNYSKHNKKAK